MAPAGSGDPISWMAHPAWPSPVVTVAVKNGCSEDLVRLPGFSSVRQRKSCRRSTWITHARVFAGGPYCCHDESDRCLFFLEVRFGFKVQAVHLFGREIRTAACHSLYCAFSRGGLFPVFAQESIAPAAIAATQMQIPDSVIQDLGRCSSPAVLRYMQVPLAEYSNTLSNACAKRTLCRSFCL